MKKINILMVQIILGFGLVLFSFRGLSAMGDLPQKLDGLKGSMSQLRGRLKDFSEALGNLKGKLGGGVERKVIEIDFSQKPSTDLADAFSTDTSEGAIKKIVTTLNRQNESARVSLNLSGRTDITSLKGLEEYNIVELNLTAPSGIDRRVTGWDWATWNQLAYNLPEKLEILNLTGWKKLEDKDFGAIFKKCPNLKKIIIPAAISKQSILNLFSVKHQGQKNLEVIVSE